MGDGDLQFSLARRQLRPPKVQARWAKILSGFAARRMVWQRVEDVLGRRVTRTMSNTKIHGASLANK
jgi:hypothetical protein